MKLIVQKFGGSSLASVEKIINVAKIITNTYDFETNVIVVVSAQGDTTDWLIKKMLEVSKIPSRREMDVLMSSGEQISSALLAAYINSLGIEAVSLTGWQAGIFTDSVFGSARIKNIDNSRILKELEARKVVIVAGFQGIDDNENITTLGRGGSDTSAVALAVSLGANVCQIFTDVDGVYTADPRMIEDSKKIDEITFDEMLEMSSLGAKVLHNRSVELAKQYNLELNVLSSFTNNPGTCVKEVVRMEKEPIRGIAFDEKIMLVKIRCASGEIYSLLSDLESKNIFISAIAVNSREDGTSEISLVISKDYQEELEQLFRDKSFDIDNNLAKISVVGAGLMSRPEVLSRLFKVLYLSGVEPILVSTSEIAISVIVDKLKLKNIVKGLHEEYKLNQ